MKTFWNIIGLIILGLVLRHYAARIILPSWVIIALGILGILAVIFGIYFGVDRLANADLFFTYVKENAVKFRMQGEKFRGVIDGLPEHIVQPDGKIIPLSSIPGVGANATSSYNGVTEYIWGAEWIGFPPNNKILSWREAFVRDDEKISKHPLAIRYNATLPMERTNLPLRRRVNLVLEGFELADKLSIDIALQVELLLVNTTDAMFKYADEGGYSGAISGRFYERMQGFVGHRHFTTEANGTPRHATGVEFTQLIAADADKIREALVESFGPYALQLKEEQKSIEDATWEQIMEVLPIAGHVILDILWQDLDVSLDAISQEVLRAILSETVKDHQGRADAIYIKHIGEEYRNYPEALKDKLYTAIERHRGAFAAGGAISLAVD